MENISDDDRGIVWDLFSVKAKPKFGALAPGKASLAARQRSPEEDEDSGQQRAPPFTANEKCRLLHVILDPEFAIHLAAWQQKLNRMEIDQLGGPKAASPFAQDGVWTTAFNNDINYYHNISTEESPQVRQEFDPNIFQQREGYLLQTKWLEIRKNFTLVYNKYIKSGQSECGQIAFDSFNRTGDEVLGYMFDLVR